MKQYQVAITKEDPVITLALPVDILRDLALCSQENGTHIEYEIACRLARSLERYQEMSEQDNKLACAAFEIYNQTNVK